MTRVFVYGMLLDRPELRPGVTVEGVGVLHGWALRFYGCTGVRPAPGERVHGLVLQLDAAALADLDHIEGVAADVYRRETVTASTRVGNVWADVYVPGEWATQEHPPTLSYLTTVRHGYFEWDLPVDALDAAVRRARALETVAVAGAFIGLR